jgi:hypothetical protein
MTFPYAEPPVPAAAIEVAPGIHWIRMPLPFALDHINLWLIEEGDGWALIADRERVGARRGIGHGANLTARGACNRQRFPDSARTATKTRGETLQPQYAKAC